MPADLHERLAEPTKFWDTRVGSVLAVAIFVLLVGWWWRSMDDPAPMPTCTSDHQVNCVVDTPWAGP
jgi:hypothetical protein